MQTHFDTSSVEDFYKTFRPVEKLVITLILSFIENFYLFALMISRCLLCTCSMKEGAVKLWIEIRQFLLNQLCFICDPRQLRKKIHHGQIFEKLFNSIFIIDSSYARVVTEQSATI